MMQRQHVRKVSRHWCLVSSSAPWPLLCSRCLEVGNLQSNAAGPAWEWFGSKSPCLVGVYSHLLAQPVAELRHSFGQICFLIINFLFLSHGKRVTTMLRFSTGNECGWLSSVSESGEAWQELPNKSWILKAPEEWIWCWLWIHGTGVIAAFLFADYNLPHSGVSNTFDKRRNLGHSYFKWRLLSEWNKLITDFPNRFVKLITFKWQGLIYSNESQQTANRTQRVFKTHDVNGRKCLRKASLCKMGWCCHLPQYGKNANLL